MNWLIFISGLFAGFTTIGHFTMGSKMYLRPAILADFDEVSKKVIHCVFHYISVFLIISSAALLSQGLGVNFNFVDAQVVKFIALNYAFFAVVQVIIALTSKIQNGLAKMFQWVFFALIAIFAWLGAS